MIKRTLASLKAWAKRIKSEIYALYIAMHDPRTPVHAKYFAMLVIGYALSPIDLIPDFIPVLGLLDDLILLPLGIIALEKMIPPAIMVYARKQADKLIRTGLPASQYAAMIIVAIWALVLSSAIWWLVNRTLLNGGIRPTAPVPASTISTHDLNGRRNTDNNQKSDSDRSRSRERSQD